MLRFLLTIVICITCSGCTFILFPHIEQRVSQIEGIVFENGIPKENVKVYFHGERIESCAPSEVLSVSDENGRFYFKGKKKLVLYITIGDPVYYWSLCLESESLKIDGFHYFRIGYTPTEVNLTCELTETAKEYISGKFICEHKKSNKVN